MSPNRRIFLNVLATYGRSLYVLAVGLFCGRWTLMALGEVDYGLNGLIGGLAAFVSFFNGILANSVSRFYAVSVGAALKEGNECAGLEECRKWFNTALLSHTVLPVLLVIIGYPVGMWAIEHFLTIPDARVVDCVWVWRFTCVMSFIGMINVPFGAMYNAKQDIAELTLYTFFTTTVNAFFLYYMVTHPGVWLAKFSCWTCIIFVLPQLIIILRAFIKYPECRIIRVYMFDRDKYVELLKFAFARFWTELSMLIGPQGSSILVNKYAGPAYNASMAIGGCVASHTVTLSGALTGAFTPAVGNLYGEGREDEMREMCFRTCRIGSLLMLIFAVPVALEIEELLILWLKNPPDFATWICVAVLFNSIVNRMAEGYPMAIYSKGYRVMSYSWSVGWSGISGVFVLWLCFALGMGMWSVVTCFVYTAMFTLAVRLYLGKELVGFDSMYWLRTVCLPMLLLIGLSLAAGYTVTLMLQSSLFRIILTTLVCEVVMIPLAWWLVLSGVERDVLVCKFKHAVMLLFSHVMRRKEDV